MDKVSKGYFVKYCLYLAGATFCAIKAIDNLLSAQRHETINYTLNEMRNVSYSVLDMVEEKYPDSAASLDKFCNDHGDEIMELIESKFGK